jgi:uncharacterized protein YbjT (DUF2867 family)
MILVTGATGSAGSQVVRALLERGRDVRVLARDPGKAHRLFGNDAELAPGDFTDPQSVHAALDGVQAMLLSCADDPRRVEWETGAIDAAAAAGVRRIVRLSTVGARIGSPVAFWDWHGRVERHLRLSGVPAVVLRSTFYMSNLLAAAEHVARDGRIYAPASEARIAMIDPRDVGASAAAALTGAGDNQATYTLTGPEATTYAQVADALAAATGRAVEFVDVPDQAAHQAMVEAGMPELVAEQLVNVFRQLRRGVAEQTTNAVESLTGSAPHSFAAFARDHASVFAPAPIGAQR